VSSRHFDLFRTDRCLSKASTMPKLRKGISIVRKREICCLALRSHREEKFALE
jgi:hypothetical protein